MREWLSGGAPPCQGGGRGFDPRLALLFLLRDIEGYLLFCFLIISCHTNLVAFPLLQEYNNLMQIWFIGRTLASQAGKVGSTPIICFFCCQNFFIKKRSRLCQSTTDFPIHLFAFPQSFSITGQEFSLTSFCHRSPFPSERW